MFRSLLIIILSGCIGSYAKSPTALAPKPKNQITVMVIDTGIDALHERLQGRVEGDVTDLHGHGTHVAGIILYGNEMNVNNVKTAEALCPEVKLISCRYYGNKQHPDHLEESIRCVNEAIEKKVNYINYSGGGTEFSMKEFQAFEKFSAQGGISVVAAGNEMSNLIEKNYYPASYHFKLGVKNMFVVSNIDPSGHLVPSSNYHPEAIKEHGQNILSTLPGSSYGYMTGTSQAAPAYLHTILKQKCKQLESKK